jgi:hypothetical protein
MKWNDTVYDPRLPKANLIWIKWHWFWFRRIWDKALGRPPRVMWKSLFWLPTRYANAWAVYIGPLNIGWRRPWLAGPAGFELERLARIEAFRAMKAGSLDNPHTI